MGSYHFTCSVSDLPIGYGDKVKIVLLSQYPFKSEGHGLATNWQPRTIPMDATYDDCGTFTFEHNKLLQNNLLKFLRKDLVELGVGDNSYHDIAVKKDMDFEELMNCIYYDRVSVHNQKANEKRSEIYTEDRIPKGFPTILRIEEYLKKKFPTVEFYVDELAWGHIRIRLKDHYTPKVRLQTIQKSLSYYYKSVVTYGSGAYAHQNEIWVLPKPGIENETDFHVCIYKEPEYKPMAIKLLVIREDVWNSLLKLKSMDWGDEESFDQVKQNNREKLNNILKYLRDERKDLKHWEILLKEKPSDENIQKLVESLKKSSDYVLSGNEEYSLYLRTVVTTVGINEHFIDLAKEVNDKKKLEPIVDRISEFRHISEVLASIRHIWKPGHGWGPQFGEWKAHKEYFKAMFSVAMAAYREDKAKLTTKFKKKRDD